MVRAFSWLLAAFLLPFLGVALLVALALEPKPLVDRAASISPASIADARRLVALNDPRTLRNGEERHVAIPTRLIDDAVNHIASRSWRARAAFVVADRGGEFRLTVRAPMLPRFLNLSARVPETDGVPQIASATLGGFRLPAALAEFGLAVLLRQGGHVEELTLARSAIRHLAYEPARSAVVVTYVWDAQLLDRARSLALGDLDTKRIEAAQRALAVLVGQPGGSAPLPLTAILTPLLGERGSDRGAQRRAALLVLAAHQAGKNLQSLVPVSAAWPQPRPRVLTLQGREDSAQHFVISAALALWAGQPVADAIGLAKEIDDARHGSGFSFADLAADRAGTRFGETLLRDPSRIDALLARGVTDADLLPSLDGLPEFLSEREFRNRYGSVGSPRYRELQAAIETRLASLPLYR